VIGTLSALARASSVPSDGEMLPFSIFDSMPAEMPAAAPSSVTVRSIALRNRRTSRPMLASSGRTDSSLGAADPVRRSVSTSGSLCRRTSLAGTRTAAGRCFGSDRGAIVVVLAVTCWNCRRIRIDGEGRAAAGLTPVFPIFSYREKNVRHG